ncbi:MAG TPA: hypothetical protein PLR64_02290 [Candidatus Dojkabacteria bacterium]|nr:hypothetical protein [Candidatus Dojkabacteria bacterium]
MRDCYEEKEFLIKEKYKKEWGRIQSSIPTFQHSEYANRLRQAMQDELIRSRSPSYSMADAAMPIKFLTEHDTHGSSYNNYYAGIDPANLPNTHIPECERNKINKPSKILLLCH